MFRLKTFILTTLSQTSGGQFTHEHWELDPTVHPAAVDTRWQHGAHQPASGQQRPRLVFPHGGLESVA